MSPSRILGIVAGSISGLLAVVLLLAGGGNAVGRRLAPPERQDVWVATGTGGKPLQWKVREGDWSIVAMNRDGSPGVSFGAKVQARIPFLHRIAVWALIAGGLLTVIATALLTWAARSRVATPA
jgi:hypothetical protein